MNRDETAALAGAPGKLASLRPEALGAPESGIVEVFNYGRGRQGLIPLWVGEGDTATPAFICEAMTRSLAAGETFYTHQRGIPELREAIARYMTRVYGSPHAGSAIPFAADRFFATTGGMHALQIAVRMVAGPDDEVIVPTPAWPNFNGALAVSGARAVEVAMRLGAEDGNPRWLMDIDRMVAAITPRTTAIIVNTPSNPTGWTATMAELAAILDLARRHGVWIVADEIYGRITFGGVRAPSFHDLIDESDRVMFVQTLSKNWAMTGLRCGWLEAPAELGQVIENLVQYSTSGAPVPVQRAAVAALDRGEDFFAHQLARFRKSRDILCDGLAATGRVHFARPDAAFYVFARIDGFPDTRNLCLQLVDQANVGVAPGSAFGHGAQDFVRICFAPKPDDMAEATRRLVQWLAA